MFGLIILFFEDGPTSDERSIVNASSESEERAIDFLTPLLAQFDKIYYDLAKRHGESYFGMWVLEEIGDKPEGVTQKQLCEILYSPKQTVNSLVASFVRRGLVETKPNSTDGRSKLHVLTAAGKEKLDAIRRDERMLGIYSLDGVSREELDQVRRVLFGIADRCTKGVAFLNANEPFPWEGGE